MVNKRRSIAKPYRSAHSIANRGGDGGGAGSDYAGIALLITAIGTLITGVITSVIGVVIALRKPTVPTGEAGK